MCLRLVHSQLTNLSTISVAKAFDAFLERCGMATMVRGETKLQVSSSENLVCGVCGKWQVWC